MLPFINPLPLLVTFAAAFGVLFHDTQFDHAAATALSMPAMISEVGSIETSLRTNSHHTHVERGSYSSTQPTIQPRSDGKKYVLRNKLIGNSFGSDYLWPSV